jgi:AcrR family transcriptional regulator
MPPIKKQDLRVQKTKEAIYAAFKQMICEMDADKITIKELTDRARIHYKTFYLHYTCIEALFEDVIGQMLEGYFREIDKIPVDAPFTETNRVFFEFMSRQEPYMEKVISAPSYREFAGRGFLAMMKHNRARHNPYAAFSPEEQNIINTYLCTTSINLYRQWTADGKVIPLEKMIELSGTLLNDGINALVKAPGRN